MALQLSQGCDAYVTFEIDGADTLFLEYDWGHHTTGSTADDGDLYVFLFVTGPEAPGEVPIFTHVFDPQDNNMKPEDFFSPDPWELGPFGLFEETFTVEVHFVGSSTGRNDWALVDNVNIHSNGAGFLPLGTITYTQGYYGSSPEGEVLNCEILTLMDYPTLSIIGEILTSPAVGVPITDLQVESAWNVGLICDYLVGTAEPPGPDGGFMPAGKVDGRPKSNLASQMITLQLNLNLDLVLPTWMEEGDAIPIEVEHNINIDPVPDSIYTIHPFVYPLNETLGDPDEELGYCGFPDEQDLCPAMALADLTELGEKVLILDEADGEAGTTVEDIMDAADILLAIADAPDTTMVPVGPDSDMLSQIQIINILSLINKSYHNGVDPTGFVTHGDPD